MMQECFLHPGRARPIAHQNDWGKAWRGEASDIMTKVSIEMVPMLAGILEQRSVD